MIVGKALHECRDPLSDLIHRLDGVLAQCSAGVVPTLGDIVRRAKSGAVGPHGGALLDRQHLAAGVPDEVADGPFAESDCFVSQCAGRI